MTAPTVKDYLAAQIDLPPLASTDTDLLLDLDFRKGKTAIEALLPGFTHATTGELWDPTLGWNPGQSARFYNTAWAGAATLGTSFAIYFEVQRSAIASTFADDNAALLDCSNGPSGITGVNVYGTPGKTGMIFQLGMSAGNFDNVEAHYQVNTGPVGRFVMQNRINATGSQGQMAMTFNDDYLNTEDQFAKIAIVCDGLTEYYYIDGHLRGIYTRAVAANASASYTALRLADDGSGTNGLIGWIRRVQIIKRACKAKNYNAPRLGLIWDSFGVRGCNQTNPTITGTNTSTGANDVANINGVQNMLNDNILSGNPNFGSDPATGPYYSPTMFALQKLASTYGARFRLFNASDSGHGWASDIAQIRQGFFDAMGQYDPEILICGGSVNDVNYSTTPAANLLGDIQNRLTYVAAQCRNLRKILFIETFPGWKCGSASWNTTAKVAEYKRQLALLPGIQGYAVTTKDGRTVTVQYVPTYNNLGGDNYNAKINLGGSTEAQLWQAMYSTSGEYGVDVHSGQYGMNRHAEIIWPALSGYLLGAAQYYS